ncbi:MAG: glucose PTS transporter subunit IIA [Lachnospiraceae bacterium]|jgi:PTS system sucrose-specific IIC component|nr:glucose PTS transporter subunit IIA [Lachnospiraceae bacterium]MCI1397647.1 glucose PTS transporter subunit IIA [Lachnospiraceae bacterium]MCI1423087.1 glucose PTS transporter subunit IIA [Lachnospiraceae bacterium]MCI1451932.1 glucose PTS transporter subunit IIA [Lachnospiraceae bacterium]MDD5849819.1 glucose PTS transporter subunit IIA [Bacillota bacterium]
MALDYHKCAQEIVDNIGGRENIAQAAHCATRLRLVIKDNSKVNDKALENVEGVKGKFESNGQLQLIIGTGTVNKVYDEFLAITGMTAATKDDVKAAAAAKQPVWKQMLKALGDVFVPILPAIVASGLMMGLIEALGKAIPSFSTSDWYQWLDMISSTAFAYLPVIVAVSAARVFGGNIFLGAVVGLSMINSSLLNGWSVGSADAINSFFGVTDGAIPVWHLLFFNVRRSGYQGHVIPVIIAVWIMCKVENWLHKHVPEMIDLFVTPLCTVLATCFLTFTIIGPIFAQLETWVLEGAKILVGNPFGAAAMGALYPWTVVMGLHHMYNIIEAGMLASTGLNTWMPIASAANFAQFGACLAVGLKTKNQKTKVVAVPSSLSAALGITEPAIFGVNLRFFKPFIAAMIGGIVGSFYGAVSGIGATAYGVTGIPGYLTIDKPLQYTILLVISGGIAFALTNVMWKEEEPEEEKKAPEIKKSEDVSAADNVPLGLGDVVIRCNAGDICKPLNGTVIPYNKIADPTFASGALGMGVGIEPEGDIVYAPLDGNISSVAESKHAIGITGAGDMEVLIHVGIDTVEMNGDGFIPYVKEGDKVKKGQPLLKFDIDKIKAAGHPDTVVVLLTNSDDYDDVTYGAKLNK